MATQIGVDAFQTFNISNGIAIQTAEVIVGPSAANSIVITATGIDTWDGAFVQPTAKTAVRNVFLQARQSRDINQDNGWADQFALQFISWENAGTNNLQITFRTTRLDILYESSPPPDVGWGQPLQVDIMLVTYQSGSSIQ